jgi:tetraacyldisaccharide 4'-kinase
MNPFASLILPPLSAIYSVVTRARVTAYQRGWFSVSKLSVPVISVGNLTTGGTGKTPMVEWVCKVIARETGKKVCVLTRGYGRDNPQSQVLVSDGSKLLAGERESGDEPYLLARNLIGIAAVICNPNRFAAGEWAIKNLGSEVFVLDDGFQHLSLARDLNIVTIDATNPWGGGNLLPYGRLREPRSGLSRADAVVVTRTEQIESTAAISDTVKRLADAVPVFKSRMVVSGIRRLNAEEINAEGLLAKPLAAFCGVGNPDSFFKQLRREGYNLVLTRAFSDHHDYTRADLSRLVQHALMNGASDLITTAKDALKLTSLELELPCHVLEIRISIAEDERLVELIRNACAKVDG